MTSNKLRIIENLILITFPVVLFAGCAGSDIKPAEPEQSSSTFFGIQKQEASHASPASGKEEISVVEYHNSNEQTVTKNDSTDPANNTEENRTPDPTDLTVHSQKPVKAITTAIPKKEIFFFNTNVYTLSDEQRIQLAFHANYLKSNPGTVLIINGHADERGSEDYNQSLSEKRAMETQQLLVGLGVSKEQLITKGFGELVPMKTENNWDENRRVELEYTDPMMLSSM